MNIDNSLIGKYIAELRASKGITQSELGDRLSVSFQAVSKWERGEALPDISVLPDLSDILGTTVDDILRAGKKKEKFKGSIKISDMIEGLLSLKKAGELLGKDNLIYRHAINGINTGMNTDIEAAFSDEYAFEAFVAEATIQNLANGFYVDITDINRSFKNEHFRSIVLKYAKNYDIT